MFKTTLLIKDMHMIVSTKQFFFYPDKNPNRMTWHIISLVLVDVSLVYVLSNYGHHNWFVESLLPHFKTTFIKLVFVCVRMRVS